MGNSFLPKKLNKDILKKKHPSFFNKRGSRANGSQRMALGTAARRSCKLLGCAPDLPNQKLWRFTTYVVTSPLGLPGELLL